MDATALIPLKVKSDKQWELFKRCFASYVSVLKKHNISLHVACESSEKYKVQIKRFIENNGLKIEKTIESSGYVAAIKNLIQSVNTSFFFFIVDDVELLKNKDFILPCVSFMQENPQVVQIKIGGGLVYSRDKKKNTELYSAFYKINVCNEVDTIWTGALTQDRENYIFSHYNCVLRTDIFQLYDNKNNKNACNWDDYVVLLKRNYLQEFEGYETGWLNFEDYLHAWGRTDLSILQANQLLEQGEKS